MKLLSKKELLFTGTDRLAYSQQAEKDLDRFGRLTRKLQVALIRDSILEPTQYTAFDTFEGEDGLLRYTLMLSVYVIVFRVLAPHEIIGQQNQSIALVERVISKDEFETVSG
jgi:hypothetical protein